MRLVFISDRHDPHRDRFAGLFSGLTSSYLEIVLDGPAGSHDAIGAWESPTELKSLLENEPTLLVSGPLDSVSSLFAGGAFRHVGISWATDVMVTAATSQEELIRLTRVVTDLDAVITDNVATENALVSLGVDSNSILRVPWGPDGAPDIPGAKRKDFGLPTGIPLILFPRSVAAHYQPDVFVEAIRKVIDSGVILGAVLIESGPLVEDVKRSIKNFDLGGVVSWVAPRAAEDFRKLISVCDAIVVSPVTDGTSVTVLEAMEIGVPVISSLNNGSAEWVLNGVTGWTFPAGNAHDFAGCISTVVKMDPDWRDMITSNAKRLVSSRAGWKRSASQLSELLKNLLEI